MQRTESEIFISNETKETTLKIFTDSDDDTESIKTELNTLATHKNANIGLCHIPQAVQGSIDVIDRLNEIFENTLLGFYGYGWGSNGAKEAFANLINNPNYISTLAEAKTVFVTWRVGNCEVCEDNAIPGTSIYEVPDCIIYNIKNEIEPLETICTVLVGV